jgi:hypothetical protein
MMRRALVCCLIALTGALIAPAVASAGSASPKSGLEHLEVTAVDKNPAVVVASGVFGGAGVEYARAAGDLVVFRGGGFSIYPLGASASTTIDPRTCLVTISLSGLYTIGNGFGVYKGILGVFGVYRGTTVGVASRHANGTCSNSPPYSTVTRISALGPITL